MIVFSPWTADWTKENLQKLLVAMKSNIPEQARQQAYNKCLKAVDWQSVAFPPFSPEACQEKWGKILQKVGLQQNLVYSEAFDLRCLKFVSTF